MRRAEFLREENTMLTQEEMNILVPEKLRQTEREHNIKILHAAESGSRAWGFASPDSDYDVRFIYVRPMEKYLELDRAKDVIELPVDDTWDVNGWDLDKTLKLLFRSNPTLFEWLASPICYLRTGFAERIKPLAEQYFSRKRMIYHYLNTARGDIKDRLCGETIVPKKYFYMLRPILACYWVIEKNSPPPMLFSDLTEQFLPEKLRPSVEYLLGLKINSPEKAEIGRIKEIDGFINESAEKITAYLSELPEEKPKTWDSLNRFFIEELTREKT